jgi:hypothetical protein
MENVENKIVIISYRRQESLDIIPAEEKLSVLIFNKLKLKHELMINNHGTDFSSFFGQLPCIYFNGHIIPLLRIPEFLKDLLSRNDENNLYVNNLFNILREIKFCDQHLLYVTNLDRKKNKNKFINFILKLFYRNESFEKLTDEYISNRSNVTKHFSKDEKYVDLLKRNFNILNNLLKMNKEELYTKSITFSFINQHKSSYMAYKRYITSIRNEGNFLERYPSIIRIADSVDIIGQFKLTENIEKPINDNKMHFSIKKKEKKIPLQEEEIRNNTYHTLISLGIFLGFSGVILLLSKLKKD